MTASYHAVFFVHPCMAPLCPCSRPDAAASDNLTERAMEFWLVLDDVSITDLSFGTEYSRAVESKQVAQQDAQRAGKCTVVCG